MAALHEKVNAALSAAIYADKLIIFDEDKFPALWKQTNKELGQWINASDVYILMSGFIKSSLLERKLEEQAGLLSALLGADGLSVVADRIVGELSRLPRKYVVYIPLPSLEIEGEIVLAPDVKLVSVKQNANALRALTIGPRGPESMRLGGRPVTFLRIPAQGYVSWGWDQSAMRDASATAKRILSALKVRRALIAMTFFDRPTETYGLLGGFSPVFQLEATTYEDGSTDPVANVMIDPNTASYLRQFGSIFPDKMKRIADMSPLVSALTVEPADTNTKSLRSALEWWFDSAADPDPASSFVKACIALEAALGEENESSEITERLADRCAFLLNKTVADRAATRAIIRKLYTLRSKIVHGVKRRFGPEEDELRSEASVYLEFVLYTESQAIEAWWNKQHATA